MHRITIEQYKNMLIGALFLPTTNWLHKLHQMLTFRLLGCSLQQSRLTEQTTRLRGQTKFKEPRLFKQPRGSAIAMQPNTTISPPQL